MNSRRMAKSQIEIQVLNDSLSFNVANGPYDSIIRLLVPVARHAGGEITTPTGKLVFALRIDEGAALIAFQHGVEPVAIATFAWEESAGLETWEDLKAAHVEQLQELNLPVENLPAKAPDQLPWLAISFNPGFYNGPRRAEIHEAVVLIWAMAQAIRIFLRQRDANN
jgi:hypothetical protein